jgi:hypothetical protein
MSDATRPSASRPLPEKVPCAYGSSTTTSPSNEILDERNHFFDVVSRQGLEMLAAVFDRILENLAERATAKTRDSATVG